MSNLIHYPMPKFMIEWFQHTPIPKNSGTTIRFRRFEKLAVTQKLITELAESLEPLNDGSNVTPVEFANTYDEA